LESSDECVWVETSTFGSLNLPIVNLLPDIKLQIIDRLFRFLDSKPNTHNFRIIIVGDFNIRGFDWKCGLLLQNFHHCSKLKGEAICTSTCLLNLSLCIDAVGSSNLLDLNIFQFKRLMNYSCRPWTSKA
jgi:hypothetical protein